MEDHGLCSVLFPRGNEGARFEVYLINRELRSLKHYWEDCLFGESLCGEGCFRAVLHCQLDLISKSRENI